MADAGGDLQKLAPWAALLAVLAKTAMDFWRRADTSRKGRVDESAAAAAARRSDAGQVFDQAMDLAKSYRAALEEGRATWAAERADLCRQIDAANERADALEEELGTYLRERGLDRDGAAGPN